MSYISFEEYRNLGGKADESTFSFLAVSSEAKMNYLTNGRIDEFVKTFDTPDLIPIEIKQAEVEFIDTIKSADTKRDSSLTSYSNGIESFGYGSTEGNVESDLIKRLSTILAEYLWRYPELLYRGRRK